MTKTRALKHDLHFQPPKLSSSAAHVDMSRVRKVHGVLQGAPPKGRQLYFTLPSSPDPLLKASKAPFLTFRVATPSGAPRQALLEKLQNESSPNFFRIFVPSSARILLRISPEIFEDFSCFVSWEAETRKNSPKIPGVFQCKIPSQIRKRNSQNLSGEQAK